MRDFDDNIHPFMEEKRLKELLGMARKQRDKTLEKETTKKLVKLFVSQGEYFKMADKPDPKIAKRYLEKALHMQEDHPIANYRLGYLYYRNREYTKAVSFFEKALDGSMEEELNDTQRMLANMFLVNCGIKIAKEAIHEINFIEDNVYTELEIERIERYKNEILVLDEEIFNKMFYRKIENGNEEKIGEYEFINFKPDINQILLKRSDQGMEIHFQDYEPFSLNPKSFYTLYGILMGKGIRTYRELQEIASNGCGQEVSDDYIRQIIRRLSRDIPYWGHIIETTSILHPETRRPIAAIKLADGFSACFFCRVEDYLPDYQ
jgi:tetratricopeptide (TPR) repeat protein